MFADCFLCVDCVMLRQGCAVRYVGDIRSAPMMETRQLWETR